MGCDGRNRVSCPFEDYKGPLGLTDGRANIGSLAMVD